MSELDQFNDMDEFQLLLGLTLEEIEEVSEAIDSEVRVCILKSGLDALPLKRSDCTDVDMVKRLVASKNKWPYRELFSVYIFRRNIDLFIRTCSVLDVMRRQYCLTNTMKILTCSSWSEIRRMIFRN